MPPARLQVSREVGSLAELGDLQIHRAHPGVPLPRALTVGLGEAGIGPLVRAGAHQLGDLGVHQLLHQQAQPVAQELGVGSSAEPLSAADRRLMRFPHSIPYDSKLRQVSVKRFRVRS